MILGVRGEEFDTGGPIAERENLQHRLQQEQVDLGAQAEVQVTLDN
jgi:hypothetical protein